ncbi:MAG: hypothetical protein H0T48_07325 [Gemmatimonadaceae bacterium]|nr:hypothetical protein [Gemmatimonadaceae bacterium]
MPKAKLSLSPGGSPKAVKAPPRVCCIGASLEVGERGVCEIIVPYPGVRRFEVIATGGEWLKSVEMPAHLTTQAMIDDLWEFLDGEDPPQSTIGLVR